jgi:hypothetical protein
VRGNCLRGEFLSYNKNENHSISSIHGRTNSLEDPLDDVKSTFLNGYLEGEVYMYQP